MARLVVQIGAHKTGTTALQSSFAAQDRLLRKQGVLYPRSNWFHYSQHRLAFALKGWADPAKGGIPDFDTEIAALEREISRAGLPAVFISSEELLSCPPGAVARGRKAFTGAPSRPLSRPGPPRHARPPEAWRFRLGATASTGYQVVRL